MNVALISAIYGMYDQPKTLAYLNRERDDFMGAYLWTDDENVARQAVSFGWTAILDEDPTGDMDLSPMLKAKFIKTHPHLAAPNADVSIWIDGSMVPTEPEFIELCLEALGNDDISFTPHPLRNCIHPEASVTAALARYGDVDPIKQVQFYERIGHPRNWGLFASGAFTVRHTELTKEWGEHWYHDCVYHTYQDQLSLPVITRIMMMERGLKWNARMPWAQWWGIVEHGF